MTSDPQLKRWYRNDNRKFFNGELPDDTILCWEPCPGSHGDTQEVDEPSDEGEGKVLLIRLDPGIRAANRGARHTWAKMVLRHEMVHVKLWPHRRLTDHGRRFDEEIQRLCTYKAYRELL